MVTTGGKAPTCGLPTKPVWPRAELYFVSWWRRRRTSSPATSCEPRPSARASPRQTAPKASSPGTARIVERRSRLRDLRASAWAGPAPTPGASQPLSEDGPPWVESIDVPSSWLRGVARRATSRRIPDTGTRENPRAYQSASLVADSRRHRRGAPPSTWRRAAPAGLWGKVRAVMTWLPGGARVHLSPEPGGSP